MYKITTFRMLLGLIPVRKTYKAISHAYIMSGNMIEIVLEDGTIYQISVSKLSKIKLHKEIQPFLINKPTTDITK